VPGVGRFWRLRSGFKDVVEMASGPLCAGRPHVRCCCHRCNTHRGSRAIRNPAVRTGSRRFQGAPDSDFEDCRKSAHNGGGDDPSRFWPIASMAGASSGGARKDGGHHRHCGGAPTNLFVKDRTGGGRLVDWNARPTVVRPFEHGERPRRCSYLQGRGTPRRKKACAARMSFDSTGG